jgi:HK97 family phage prohead protease
MLDTMARPIVDVERRLLSGYAAVFDVIDTKGDLLERGCFARALAEKTPAEIPLLVDHDPGKQIGEAVELAEGGVGLYATFKIYDEATSPWPFTDGILNLVARRWDFAMPHGLSVGIHATDVSRKAAGGPRRIRGADLREISLGLTAEPANALARLGPRRERVDYAAELAQMDAWIRQDKLDELARERGVVERYRLELKAMDPEAYERDERRRRVLERLRAFDPLTNWEARL